MNWRWLILPIAALVLALLWKILNIAAGPLKAKGCRACSKFHAKFASEICDCDCHEEA